MNKPSLGFIISLALTTVFIFSAHLNNAVDLSPKYDPVADLATTWINNPTVRSSTDPNRAAITPVLSLSFTSPFISGFYCFSDETSCFFGILIFTERNKKGTVNAPYYDYTELVDPQLVWSANRDRSVKVNARLNFTGDEDLILEDADGHRVCSTNTGGKSVTGLRFTEFGNLVLFDSNNATVWQSFDYPTDSLLIGQKLVSDSGQKLIARTSSSNFSRGLFSLSVQQGSLLGYMETNPPLVYYNSTLEANPNIINLGKEYVEFKNGSFNGQYIPLGSTTQFMRLEPNGHLKVYQGVGAEWKTVVDLLQVQNSPTKQPSSPPLKKSRNRSIILGSSLGAFFGACLLVGSCIFVSKMKREQKELDDEFSVDKVPGMPTRFSYDDLKIATNDFNNQLGKGGFGSVFKGTLRDGTQIAVKRLNGSSRIKKSFLAEVQTIGNIHHVNLVRLIGFCAENSNRLLVYEYMSNGSLDRWIFERHQELTLGWESRRKIIADIAKGLAYLHEECRQKIYHLDVKPENILLDEKFEAKVSDFGLAKLIDKDQSKVLATLGGTPGYMAPEWLSSIITEKVDVYSFWVVVLEILCGRKNLDRSQPEEEMHLLGLFERKGEEGHLLDMVDKSNADMQLHRAEVVEMMKLAVWCLQSD